MQHTDARLDRRDRIERQIIEAMEQCERLTVPVLDAPVDFAALIRDRSLFPVIVGVARDDAPPALDVMARTKIASILVGPEGGFAVEEIDAMRENPGFLPVSLGTTILRAETAALSLLCLWQAARRVQT
jgi:16S rRNA (uracil1498-N3)-methyltransferase